jgi:hypothetical protein
MLHIILNSNKFLYQEKTYKDTLLTGRFSYLLPTYVEYLYCDENIFIHEDDNTTSFKKKTEDIIIENHYITNNCYGIVGIHSFKYNYNTSLPLLPLRKISTVREIGTFRSPSEEYCITTYKIDFSLREKQSLLKKIKTFLKKVLC